MFVDANGFDPVGDAGGAPDVGFVEASVLPDGNLESMIVGTWLDHSTLAVGEHISWLLDFGPGLADGPSGFDYLLELWHHAGFPQQWGLYTWKNGAWQPTPSSWVSLSTRGDGRVYWRMSLQVPDQSRTITLRAYTGSTATGGSDVAPNLSNPRLSVSLVPHGAEDPLLGCIFNGGCVAPANSLDPYGSAGGGDQLASGRVASNCSLATQNLRAIDRKISQVRAARRRAGGSARRRLDGQLRSLSSQRTRQAATATHLCG